MNSSAALVVLTALVCSPVASASWFGDSETNKPVSGNGNCGIAEGIFGLYKDEVVGSKSGNVVLQKALIGPNPGTVGSPSANLFFEAVFGDSGQGNDGLTGYVCVVKLKQETKGHVVYECASNANLNPDGTPNFEIIDLEIDFSVNRRCQVQTKRGKIAYTRSGEVLGPTRDEVGVFVSVGKKN